MNENSLKNKTVSGAIWSLGEKILAKAVSFVVSVIIARMVLPEEYGVVAIGMVVISICDVFLSSGFCSSLIQKEKVDAVDFSSFFYFGLGFSTVLYFGIFFLTPYIAEFYKQDALTPVIRVMSLTLIIGAVRAPEYAFLSRNMQFKKFFWSTFGGTVVSAIVGIILAYKGFGVWALVTQTMTNSIIDTTVLTFTSGWKPVLKFSFSRLKELLSYGWKVLTQDLIYVIYNDLRTLIIGKVYSSDDLAYYNKGQQFPNMIATIINPAISSALLPALSRIQGEKERIKYAMKQCVKIETYVLFPVMLGLAAVADPLVRLLLTDRWEACIPILRILCIAFAFAPLQTTNLMAVMAIGRTDISLKAEIVKRVINIFIIFATFRISVMAIAVGEVVSSIICWSINCVVFGRIYGYSIWEQTKDMIPSIAMSVIMGMTVYSLQMLKIGYFALLILQIFTGGVIYIGISILFKNQCLKSVLDITRGILSKTSQEK